MAVASFDRYISVFVGAPALTVPTASFGYGLLFHESSVGGSGRIHGPFSSAQSVLDYGYASGSPPHLYAQAYFAQVPRGPGFYVARVDSGDANLAAAQAALLAEDGTKGYIVDLEPNLRNADDILTTANWIEGLTYPKIGLFQNNAASMISGEGPEWEIEVGGTATDGDYDVIFTGFGFSSPQTVTVTRSTTPATNADLAAAIDAELVVQNGGSGDIEGILDFIDSAAETVTIKIVDGLPSGTVTVSAPAPGTLTATLTDADIATQFFVAQFGRSGLVYHSVNTEMLTAAWVGSGTRYNLDARNGYWGMLRLAGSFTANNLSENQVTALRAMNVNYFAPAALSQGQPVLPFTAQGFMAAGTANNGTRISSVISDDFMQARLQEALTNTMFAVAKEGGALYDQAGIDLYRATIGKKLGDFVAAQHLVERVVPVGETYEGESTPKIFAPRFSELSNSEINSGEVIMSAIAYRARFIEKVTFRLLQR